MDALLHKQLLILRHSLFYLPVVYVVNAELHTEQIHWSFFSTSKALVVAKSTSIPIGDRQTVPELTARNQKPRRSGEGYVLPHISYIGKTVMRRSQPYLLIANISKRPNIKCLLTSTEWCSNLSCTQPEYCTSSVQPTIKTTIQVSRG